MATFLGSVSPSTSSWIHMKKSPKKGNRNGEKNPKFRVSCVSSSVTDPYRTLRIRPGASESEIRKAFRQLALQYHPDVCKGNNCGVQFHEINEAYDIVMSNLRGETAESQMESSFDGLDDSFRGMNDPDWDMWEEWMGWEGAGIRDYTSHINPYI